MFLTIVSKNGVKITNENEDTIFKNREQQDRFWKWAWESIPYAEVKERIKHLGYGVRENNDVPEIIPRFCIWRRVIPEKRKPELIEFEGMKLKIRVS